MESQKRKSFENMFFPLNRHWASDALCPRCHACHSEFGIFLGRHHCRICGNIFCKRCTTFIALPPGWILKRESDDTATVASCCWLPWQWIEAKDPSRKLQQVCIQCRLFHNAVFEAECKRQMDWCFLLLSHGEWFAMKDWKRWMPVSKTWLRCFTEAISQLRVVGEVDKEKHLHPAMSQILWSHRDVLLSHSRFLMLFVAHCRREEEEKVGYLVQKFTKRTRSFPNLHHIHETFIIPCEKYCSSRLNSHQFIEYLSLHRKHLVPAIIRKWLACVAFTIPQFRTFFPILIEYFVETRDLDFQQFFIQKLRDAPALVFEFYWWLQTQVGTTGASISGTSGTSLWWNPFAEQLSPEIVERLGIHVTFIHQVFHAVDTHSTLPQQPIAKTLLEHVTFLANCHPCFDMCGDCRSTMQSSSSCKSIVHMPSQNNLVGLTSWEPETTVIINSKTQPLLLPLSAPLETFRSGYIFKSDDVCRDAILLGLIQLMDDILREDLGINFETIKYTVIPVNRDHGFIEIVPKAKTLFEIKYLQRQNLFVWLSNHNQDQKLSDLRKRFVRSCAFYCLVGFLFGIGDRHSRNILITEQGQLFHIDFGCILGENPKPFAQPELRITKDMVDCMGGEGSSSYQEFQVLCARMYQCLRKHMRLFLSLLRYLSRQKLIPMNCENVTQEIEGRFITRFASSGFDTKVLVWDSLVNKMSEKVADLYHFYLPNPLSSYTSSPSLQTFASSRLTRHPPSSIPAPVVLSLKDPSPPKQSSPSMHYVSCAICRRVIPLSKDKRMIEEHRPF